MSETLTPKDNGKRNTILKGIASVFFLAGSGIWLYEHFIGAYHETTDNAYVQGDVFTITPQTEGIIRDVNVQETQVVAKGTLLASLDDRDAALALEKAKESLALSVRQIIRTERDIETADAEINIAQRTLTKAQADLQRRENLVSTGALSAEEYQHVKEQVDQDNDALIQAQQHRASLAAAVEGTSLENNPSVRLAANNLEEALLAYKRCRIIAPCEGIIAKKSIQPGQKLSSGDRIMALVAHNQLWVDANFKETQLAHIRIGQPVLIYSDLYGKDAPFHGKVEGISPGTGATFTLLPAQNASGNWIKIVQRIPVRIALEPSELKTRPLRVGLSMNVDIDTHKRSGSILASALEQTLPPEAAMYQEAAGEAKKLIAKIIADNR